MNKLPRTFCITLKETPFRTKEFLEVFPKEWNVELFYGVFGNRMGLIPQLPNKIECPDKDIFIPPSAVGCNMSHFLLWNVLKYFPEDEFLILEDDAIPSEKFTEQFQEIYSKLPSDWEMVFVGWLPNDFPVPSTKIDNGLSLRLPSGTHAYLVKKSVLSLLIDGLLPFQSNIDLTIVNKILPRIKYYTFDPSLVDQRSYLNINDSAWTSLVYDWKSDLYKCKENLIKKLVFGVGWYNTEKDEHSIWKWSSNYFSIFVPDLIDSIQLDVLITKNNTLTIKNVELDPIELNVGINRINIPCKNLKVIDAKLSNSLVPQKEIPNNNDSRVLGICLKKITMIMGSVEIDVPIDKL